MGTRIRKALKLHLKLISLTKKWTISHKWEVTRRQENEMSQSQGSIPVMWQQQNEEEACGGKMLQKQQKKTKLCIQIWGS